MREIVYVFDYEIHVNKEDARALKSLSEKYGISEEILATIWGYISEAILDYKLAPVRLTHQGRRRPVKTVFEEYDFLLVEYSNRLDRVVEILPELGCRAATPESLYSELRSELW